MPADYFALLGLTPSFTPDEKALESAYFTAQRQVHPDRFMGKPQAERAAALQKAADINIAYRTLKDPLTRAQHLLALQGVIVGTDADTIKPTPKTLTDSMEWREAIDEAADLTPIIASLSQDYTHCLTRLEALYRAQDWPEMAQETLRLGYLAKAREAAAARSKARKPAP